MGQRSIKNGSLIAAILVSLVTIGQAQESRHRVPTLTTDDVMSKRSVVEIGDTSSLPAQPNSVSKFAKGSIDWRRDLRGALEEASSNRKVVVVDVYTDWCGWCHKMDDNIYSSPQVASLSKDAVFLKLNAEDGGEGERFAKQTGVTGFPTTFVLNSEGSVIDTAKGYVGSIPAFISFVNRARNKR